MFVSLMEIEIFFHRTFRLNSPKAIPEQLIHGFSFEKPTEVIYIFSVVEAMCRMHQPVCIVAGLKLPSEELVGRFPASRGARQRAYLSNVCTAQAAQRQVCSLS